MTKHKQNMQHRIHMGKGIGLGHGGNTKLPPLQEFELDPAFALGMEPGTRAFRLGQCSVFTSPPVGTRGWHLSISHRKRYPTWDELAKAWYETVPGAEHRIACMILPPKSEYVNLANFCFQIHELHADASGMVKLEGGEGG